MWTVVYLLCFVSSVRSADFITIGTVVCPKKERELGECLKNAINHYLPKTKANQQRGIPSPDPLRLPALIFPRSPGTAFFTSNYENLTVTGLSNVRVYAVDVDYHDKQFTASVVIPKLTVKGAYRMVGNFLKLPARGYGSFTAIYEDIDGDVIVSVDKNNDTNRLFCNSVTLKLYVKNSDIYFEKPLQPHTGICEVLNKYVSTNYKKLAKELQGPVESGIVNFVRRATDSVLFIVPPDDVFDNKNFSKTGKPPPTIIKIEPLQLPNLYQDRSRKRENSSSFDEETKEN